MIYSCIRQQKYYSMLQVVLVLKVMINVERSNVLIFSVDRAQ